METRNKEQKATQDCQKRLAEIAEILINGIYRLENKERSEIGQIPLDNKHFPSLHSTGYNPNKHIVL